MQYPTQGYASYGCPPPPSPAPYPSPANCGYPPYYSWGYPTPYNPFPGSTIFNAGGNSNGSGTQTNGDVKVGNRKEKSGGVDIGRIGGNHDNLDGQQVSGNVTIGDIRG
uniref:Uncharacterized protein n=1 Tax=Opuntia streptacantha TaxID=393608 RepID=A0A7C9D657_OPUST